MTSQRRVISSFFQYSRALDKKNNDFGASEAGNAQIPEIGHLTAQFENRADAFELFTRGRSQVVEYFFSFTQKDS